MRLAGLKTETSAEKYLAGEEISRIKDEFVDGKVSAMAGTSRNHNRITGDFYNSLSAHLRDSSGEAFIENVKIRAAEDVFYYPDISVTCKENFKNTYYCEVLEKWHDIPKGRARQSRETTHHRNHQKMVVRVFSQKLACLTNTNQLI